MNIIPGVAGVHLVMPEMTEQEDVTQEILSALTLRTTTLHLRNWTTLHSIHVVASVCGAHCTTMPSATI